MNPQINEATLAEKGLALRPVSGRDLEAVLFLSTQAGWNQRASDWQLFIDAGKVMGIFASPDSLVATAATLPYQPDLSWISMVLVEQSWRRQGLANYLLGRCLRDLAAQARVPALDATAAGSAVYAKLGFVEGAGICRMHSPHPVEMEVPPSRGLHRLAPWRNDDLAEVALWDAQRFGGRRDFILASLAGGAPNLAWTLRSPENILGGYALGRLGRQATQLGPLFAASEKKAVLLFNKLATQSSGPAYLDVPLQRSAFLQMLKNHGWSEERRFIRMSTVARGALERLEGVYGIAGPDLG